eukprot:CAMPEP_0170568560 /NCGR_PEP_ID=MMETSP0224-20130122/5_1 /TAXON_ID=285029 /ORGANISM="Togula jolla, Strain CCCM 725" /LENGTH=428 /DNA_ID=CAMNT_0010890505 /DNA_START=69 /DNA_END=1355 /DNA_ORIENTATION=-
MAKEWAHDLLTPLFNRRSGDPRRAQAAAESSAEVGALRGTPLSAAVNLAATAMGTGVLTLPFAFGRCGVARCLALLAILAVTTDVSLMLLVRAGRHLNIKTFSGTTRRLFGDTGCTAFQVMTVSILFLALTAMQRVVLDLFPIFCEEMLKLAPGTVRPDITVALVNLGVLAACLSKSFHSLRFTSGAALLCLAPFVAAIVGKASAAVVLGKAASIGAVQGAASTEGLLLAPPLLASSLCCHFSVLDIDSELNPRHRERIYGVIHTVSLIVLPLTYALVGVSGVLLFGGGVAENVLTEFHGDYAMQVARGVLSLVNALRMPLIAVPLYRLLCEMLEPGQAPKPGAPRPWAMILLLVASFVAACKLKVLTRVMGLLGGTGGVLGCFCLPAVLYLALPRAGVRTTGPRRAASVGVIAVGATVAAITVFSWF